MISSEVHKSRLYTPINNSSRQFFIKGWSNRLQRKVNTIKKTRFSLVATNTMHHFITYVFVHLTLFFNIKFYLNSALWYKKNSAGGE